MRTRSTPASWLWARVLVPSIIPLVLAACGGTTFTAGDGGDAGSEGGSSSGGSGGGSSGSSSGGSGGSSSGSSGGGSGSSSGGTEGGVRIPANHRANDLQCSQPAAPGNCSLGGGGPGICNHDSECTMGTNGRCVETTGGALTCLCTYDSCPHDTDCPMGKLCACHGSAYMGGYGNECLDGNCRVDADCGAGGYCSPSHGTNGCGGVTGYYCHTASDTCVDDSDCTSSTMGPQVCAWSSTDGRWECQNELLCQ